jgi:alpha-L-fucosidase
MVLRMTHDEDQTAQLETLRARLASLATTDVPAGLTEPDPDTPEERWNAAQVWAHMAEFVRYWHRQLADVVRSYDGAPVPFGRTKTDAARIDAIATGRHRPIAQLAAETDAEIGALEEYLSGLDDDAWSARGLHPTRGVMDVPAIVKRFVSDHLDEHAEQLEGLSASEA